MRAAPLLALVTLAGCGGAAPPGELTVRRVDLRPGVMALVVENGTDEPATLAQVAVDDGFVPYPGPVRTVAPHGTARLAVPYPWIAGQAYRITVLTGRGQALDYRLGA